MTSTSTPDVQGGGAGTGIVSPKDSLPEGFCATDGVRTTCSTLSPCCHLAVQCPAEERFKPAKPFDDKDESLVVAMQHHRMPLLVLDAKADGYPVVFASGALLTHTELGAEDIIGKAFEEVLANALAVSKTDVERVKKGLGAKEDISISFGAHTKSNAQLNMALFLTGLRTSGGEVTHIMADIAFAENAQQGAEDPSCNLAYRYRMAQNCRVAGDNWSLFRPYKKLCDSDATMIDTLQQRKDMFCITDPALHDQPLVFVSDGFVDMTGHPREEIDGINCRFLQGQATNQEDVDVIRKAVREQGNARVCLLNYRKDGTRFINQFCIAPLRDTHGRLAYFIGIQADVEDTEILPYPNSRQTMQEMLAEEDYNELSPTTE